MVNSGNDFTSDSELNSMGEFQIHPETTVELIANELMRLQFVINNDCKELAKLIGSNQWRALAVKSEDPIIKTFYSHLVENETQLENFLSTKAKLIK